jgi:hypothetical protein
MLTPRVSISLKCGGLMLGLMLGLNLYQSWLNQLMSIVSIENKK